MKALISVSQGMAGYFACMIWWNDEDPKLGFWEPYDTGYGRYKTFEEAELEAKEWALSKNLRYVGKGESFS